MTDKTQGEWEHPFGVKTEAELEEIQKQFDALKPFLDFHVVSLHDCQECVASPCVIIEVKAMNKECHPDAAPERPKDWYMCFEMSSEAWQSAKNITRARDQGNTKVYE